MVCLICLSTALEEGRSILARGLFGWMSARFFVVVLFVCLSVCLFFVCWFVHYGVSTDGSLGPVIRLISAVAGKPNVHSYIHACSFLAIWMYFFQQLYCSNGISPMGSSGCLSPRKASCDRVALPDLGCMLGVLVFPYPTEL